MAALSADELIAVFGDQAYHQGVRMTVEALHAGDKEACRMLAQANIELLKRGYHKHEPDSSPSTNPSNTSISSRI